MCSMQTLQHCPTRLSAQSISALLLCWVSQRGNLFFIHYANTATLTWSCRFILQHQRNLAISIHKGHLSDCLVPCHLEIGLLKLTFGRSSLSFHLTHMTDQECSSSFHNNVVFTPLAQCLHQMQNTDAYIQSQKWTGSHLPKDITTCSLWASSMA